MISINDGLDVIGLSLDAEEYPGALHSIRAACANVFVMSNPKPYQPGFKLSIKLHQPHHDALNQIRADCGSIVEVSVDYLEVARDFIVPSIQKALALRGCLLSAVLLPYQQMPVRSHPEFSTIYWRDRPKRGINLVLYADKPSKQRGTIGLVGKPCLHLEKRFYGAECLATAGLVTLNDIVDLDFDAFWQCSLKWQRLPRVTDLGRLLVGQARAKAVSSTRLRQIGNEFLAKEAHRVDGQFVLQNALLAHPEIADHLMQIDSGKWLADAQNRLI